MDCFLYLLCFSSRESESEASQSCPTLCHPTDYSLLYPSVHGIFQARVLEWVAISFSRGSFPPRDRTQVSRIVGRGFTFWTTREALSFKTVWYLGGNTASQVALVVKNPPANAGDVVSIPRSGKSPGGRDGNTLQYSCLGNPWTEEPGGL